MNLKLLTATAVMTAAVASPALADPHARSVPVQNRLQQERAYYRHSYYGGGYYEPGYYGSYNRGFWPGDVAADVIGGAIGTAGAIATAPFAYNAYAYNGYYNPYNGFACEPGTAFIGADGLRHLCQ
ncbi:hypothetical protein [Bradyrhizobium sp. STM 3562]|uniref:hypothetical protein n=1 Tax=Bradyrhizobium sp. STM 3562 TaxID=578924 RepID=UPI00389033B3